jgi:hypothetical protein
MRRILTFLLCALIAVLVLPSTAAADGDVNTVEFDALEGSVRGGQLTLVYRVDRRSWRQIKRQKVEPILNLWLAPSGEGDAAFSYSQRLHKRKGSFTYPKSVALRDGDRVEIEVVGYHKDWRVEATRFDDQVGAWINFTVDGGELVTADLAEPDDSEPDDSEPADEEPDQTDDEPDPKWRIGVISACKEAVYSTRVDKCVEDATKLDPHWAAATVAACADAFSSSSYITKCLKGARQHKFDAAATVAACDDAFASSSYTVECLEDTANFTSAPAPVVEACDDATVSSSRLKECIDAARGLGESAPELIEACSGSRVASCMKSASGSP